MPQNVYEVNDGIEEPAFGDAKLFMDVHKVGAGKVTPEDVAAAHKLDLAVQDNRNSWLLDASGGYTRRSASKGEAEVHLQTVLLDEHQLTES